MASSKPNRSGEDALKQCTKVLQFIMAHKDAEPFLTPVKWKEWGLMDYPRIIKTPMDLGTVKSKLDAGEYTNAKEFKHDVMLVWSNCVTYNSEDSIVYICAVNLRKIFEEKYAKMVKEDDDVTVSSTEAVRLPTLLDKKMFSQNVYNVSSEDLGRLVHILDQRCESCIKKIDAEDIEIDIDAIDPASFWEADAFIKSCMAGTKKPAASTRKAPKAATGDASASKAKKARTGP